MWKPVSAAVAAACFVAAAAGAKDYKTGALVVADPWTPPPPRGAPTAAGYLNIVNTGSAPDRLLGAASPSFTTVQIHQMSMTDGVMRMRPAPDGVALPPGQTVALSPSGYHLMFVGPRRPLGAGARIPATLRFARAGAVKVEFAVMAAPPAPDHAHMVVHR